MLRRFTLPLLAMMITLFVGQHLQAQVSQRDKIQRRLDEVRDLMAEENNTITMLEKQLDTAIDDNDQDKIDRLRTEVNSSFSRVEELQDLEAQLKKLLGKAGGSSRSSGTRRRGRAPQPAMGGAVPGDRGGDGARERDSGRPMGIAGADVSEKDMEEVRDRAGIGREKRPAESDRGDRNRRGNRSRNDAPVRRGNTVDEQRIDDLRDAMASLEAAGEFGMARSVETLIRKAEDALDEENDRARERQDARDREEAGRRDSDRARSRARDRDREDDASSRPRRPAGGNNNGPILADGPAPRNRQPARDNRDREDSNDGELDDLKERLEKLKERTKRGRDN